MKRNFLLFEAKKMSEKNCEKKKVEKKRQKRVKKKAKKKGTKIGLFHFPLSFPHFFFLLKRERAETQFLRARFSSR
jgi:hypothetical protein